MSTKIYNGYVLPVMDAVKLRKFSNRVGTQIREAAQKLVTKQAISLAVYILDRHSAGLDISGFTNNPDLKDPLFSAYCFIDDRQRDIIKSKIRDPEYDYTCSLVVLPLKDKMPCILYTEKQAFTKIWQSQKEVKPYWYWNNTEQPDDVTEKEWNQRRKTWDKALGKTGVPSLEGLVLEFSTGLPLWPPFSHPADREAEGAIAYMPAFEQRVSNIAEIVVINKKYLKENRIKAENLAEIVDYLKSKEGQRALESEKNRLKKILKPAITLKDLKRIK